jgi:hypothetical protein
MSKVGTGTSVAFPAWTGAKGRRDHLHRRRLLDRERVLVCGAAKPGGQVRSARARRGGGCSRHGDVGAAGQRRVDRRPTRVGDAAYPLSTFTYAIVPQKSGKADLLEPFLLYTIGPGQKFGAELEFAPLPAKIVAADKATIAKLTKG